LIETHQLTHYFSAHSFLDDAARIAMRGYEPTDSDVVRARLRTIGVQEHRFVFEGGRGSGNEWILYDVGGDRRARARWAPYFDDVDAIIFLAPVSVFDEKLAEDGRVNRLEDTYLLWKALSRNKLLAGVQVVLFLNKYVIICCLMLVLIGLIITMNQD
jgi:guanine nucleotide-binding protein alpha-1 subunit